MKTYQYTLRGFDGSTDETDDLVRWIASADKDYADQHAHEEGWNEAGGCIFDEAYTAELLSAYDWGGIDLVIERRDYVRYFKHCGQKWEDTWSCACNDECPGCGKEIEPYDYNKDFVIRQNPCLLGEKASC